MNGKLKQGKWYWNTSERAALQGGGGAVEVDGDDWLADVRPSRTVLRTHLERGALAAVSSPASSAAGGYEPLTPRHRRRNSRLAVSSTCTTSTALPNLQGIAAAGKGSSRRGSGIGCCVLKCRYPGATRNPGIVIGRSITPVSAICVCLVAHRCGMSSRSACPDHPLVMFCLSRSLAGADGSRITLTNAISSRVHRILRTDRGTAAPQTSDQLPLGARSADRSAVHSGGATCPGGSSCSALTSR